MHQRVRDRSAVQPNLVRAKRLRAHAAREEVELLLLDAVLQVAARAIDVFVQLAAVVSVDRSRRHDEARVVALARVLGTGDHSARSAPRVVRLVLQSTKVPTAGVSAAALVEDVDRVRAARQPEKSLGHLGES
jgi:hypothetical protein